MPEKLIRTLVSLCDGTITLGEIMIKLRSDWDEKCLLGLIRELHRRGIVADALELGTTIWDVVKNPSAFPIALSENQVANLVKKAKSRHARNKPKHVFSVKKSSFTSALRQRRSVRNFSSKPISFNSLIEILWSGYGQHFRSNNEIARTVPSAGALYPLQLSLLLVHQVGELQPGVYNVWLGAANQIGFTLTSSDVYSVARSFVDPLMVENANGAIVVSGSFAEAAKKYTNRSILFVALEAGHVAQNIHLAALKSKVATVEIGGFIESLLAKSLNLEKGYAPLTTVVFGNKSKDFVQNQNDSKMEFNWIPATADGYDLPFTLAVAKIATKGNVTWSSGKAHTANLAEIKARAEAREWAACGCVPTLYSGKFQPNMGMVDPREIVSYSKFQYKNETFPFKPFDEEARYRWAEGRDERTKTRVQILADCVYFPYVSKTPYYTYANSSGVAAHPQRSIAIEHGVLELIERDAFMIAYLGKLQLPMIKESSLPSNVLRRIRALRHQGFNVWVKDYTIDLAPVVFVFAQHEGMTYTTCAACSHFDTERAIDHALMEVEASIFQRLTNGAAAMQPVNLVQFPNEHGSLYEQKKFFHKADHLLVGTGSVAFSKIGNMAARTWAELMDILDRKKYNLYTVPFQLSKKLGGNGDLHIVRSIIPGLVPISFGAGLEPLGVPRLYEQVKVREGRILHYSDIPKFPHPYA